MSLGRPAMCCAARKGRDGWCRGARKLARGWGRHEVNVRAASIAYAPPNRHAQIDGPTLSAYDASSLLFMWLNCRLGSSSEIHFHRFEAEELRAFIGTPMQPSDVEQEEA